MKTYAFYGLGAAFLGLVLSSVLFFTGLHTDPAKLSLAGWIAGTVGLAISIVMTVLGVREVRETRFEGQEFTYAKGFQAAMMITLFSALGAVATNLLYTHVINPGYNDLMMQSQVEQMRANNVPEANISAAIEMGKKLQHPAIAGAFILIGGIFFGLVLSLIIAAFTRRKAVVPDAPPPIAS